MSAFAPYQKLSQVGPKLAPPYLTSAKDNVLSAEFVRFPYELTSILLGLPVPPVPSRSVFGLAYPDDKRPEDSARKKDSFFIRNLLKSEDATDKQKREKTKRKFDEEASKMEAIVSNLGKSDDGHRCIYCGKVYSRKYGLKIHIRTHTGYKPLKCKYCLRPFGDPSNLNKHVRLHARGQTPYNCQFCGKTLVRRRDLERHVKSKHGDTC